MIELSSGDLLSLLPSHISTDPSFAATGKALESHLQQLARSIPNLLVFARLGGQAPERMLPPLHRLTTARGGLKAPETELLEALAWQFHVDFREVAQTDAELAGMVRNSIPWHRIKGTPAGIRNALELFGYRGLRIEEDGTGEMWATWQLGLSEVPDMDTVRRVVAVCREMQPARCRLWRMYTDLYDWRPGIWSGGAPEHAWSECWWSWYSGTEIPNIPGVDDEHGLIVSFGRRDACQAEMYSSGLGAGIAFGDILASLIPYIDRPVWSRSIWSELYPMNTGFIIGELLSLLAAERIFARYFWTGPWDDRLWQETLGWDRRLPPWSMAWREWAKAQAVWSWPAPPLHKAVHGARPPFGRDGVYGEINANYSLPHVAIMGPAPRWSEMLWSDDKARIEIIRILEQFHRITSCGALPLNPYSRAHGVSMAALRTILAPYVDRPVWSASGWGDVFPRNHGFTWKAFISFLAAERVLAKSFWTGHWDERLWRETLGWDRRLRPWSMARREWARSQAVYSWPGEPLSSDRDGAYGEINANYSVPSVTVMGPAPRWGTSLWSDDTSRIEIVRILEQYHAVTSSLSLPLSPFPQPHGISMAALRTMLAPYVDRSIWSASGWGEVFSRNHGFGGASVAACLAANRVTDSSAWTGAWDERRWRRTVGWARRQPDWSMSARSRYRVQAVYSWPDDREGLFGEINASYSLPVTTHISTTRWSDHVWSDGTPTHRVEVIEEQFRASLSVSVDAVEPAIPLAVPGRVHGTQTMSLRESGWTGIWNERLWRTYVGYAAVSGISVVDELHVILHEQAPGVTAVPDDIFGRAA